LILKFENNGLISVCGTVEINNFLDRAVFHVTLFWQGGKPSPFDRNLGTKLGAKAVEKLVQQIEDSKTAAGINLLLIYVLNILNC